MDPSYLIVAGLIAVVAVIGMASAFIFVPAGLQLHG